jgi:hypothetical protein
MGLYTITLLNRVNLASTHVDLQPLSGVGGFTNEPALTLCNDAISELLLSEIDWKFNRVDAPLMVTAPNKQDYTVAGACAFTLGGNPQGAHIGLASNNAITESGTTVTVNFLEPCRFAVGDVMYMAGNTVAAYNSTFTDDGTSSSWSGGWTILTVSADKKSVTFTHASSGLAASGAPGITDFGWLTSATTVIMTDTSSPQQTDILTAVKELQPWSKVATKPLKVCVLKDNGDGTLKVRFYETPGSTLLGVKLVYQAKAPLKTSLSDNWSPFPDNYSSLYTQALLYRMYRYLDSTGSKTQSEYNKLQQEMARANGAADREQTDVHICPEESFLDGYGW